MKLLTFSPFQGMPLPGVRPGSMMTFEPGKGPYADFRIHVRGPAVFLVSPPGWGPGIAPADRVGAARRIYEIPRSNCYLGWHLEPGDKLEDVVKWSPACDDCARPIALEDHLVCTACGKDRVKSAAITPPAVGHVEMPREVVLQADDDDIEDDPVPVHEPDRAATDAAEREVAKAKKR